MTIDTATTTATPTIFEPIKTNPLGLTAYFACFKGIVWREVLRYLHQRERFLSALVRPLVWLFIFAAGFRQTLGVSIIPPYESYVLYEQFVTPGLVGMILLFNAMQSSLSMVYDRETGAMRTLLVSPFPRSFLLVSKLLGGVAVALLQVYVFLVIAHFWEIDPGGPPLPLGFGLSIPAPVNGYITLLPALVLAGLMLGALALFMSSVIKQLENFAGVMNFVIFPMFFASSALYPLWRIKESSPLLYEICRLNPFTFAVELIRFAMYGQIGAKLEGGGTDYTNVLVVTGYTVAFLAAAIYAYNPSKGLIGRRGGPGGGGA
jgi:ABC-2 type transport system permease protein